MTLYDDQMRADSPATNNLDVRGLYKVKHVLHVLFRPTRTEATYAHMCSASQDNMSSNS